MTDNEIIKDLEVLIKEQTDGYQTALEYGGKRDEAHELFLEMMESVIAMFNRQKAEIERLQNDVAISRKETKRYVHHRAEAIKEFAERLKGEMLKSKYNVTTSSYSRACNTVIDFWVEEIDNLVKEMVCDGNGRR